MLSPGVLISDRYRLDERLATGGMGDVWRATDVSLSRIVAVKILLPALLADPKFGARFRAEARMLAALHHPGVVRVYDYGETSGPKGAPITYLVMEYVEGEALSQRLAGGEPLPQAEAMRIVVQAARALHAAHTAGIVHRDVKPSNLLLRPDGSVMLVDFGVARSESAHTSITSTNAIVGTAMYMAPEQAAGKTISAATDIYALGAVAYHCLAGQPPFSGSNPLEIALRHVTDEPPSLPADVAAPVKELVLRALAKDPADRYPSASAFARAARACQVRVGASGSGTVKPASAAKTAVLGAAVAKVAKRDVVDEPADNPAKDPVDDVADEATDAVEGAADEPAAVGSRPAAPSGTTLADQQVVAAAPARRPTRRTFVAIVVTAALVLAGGITTLLTLTHGDGTPGVGNVVPPTQSSAATEEKPASLQPEPDEAPSTRRNPWGSRSASASADTSSDSPSPSADPSPTETVTTPPPSASNVPTTPPPPTDGGTTPEAN